MVRQRLSQCVVSGCYFNKWHGHWAWWDGKKKREFVCLVSAHTLLRTLYCRKRFYLNDRFQVFSKAVKGQFIHFCMPNKNGICMQITLKSFDSIPMICNHLAFFQMWTELENWSTDHVILLARMKILRSVGIKWPVPVHLNSRLGSLTPSPLFFPCFLLGTVLYLHA